jgi:hypothetical protein
MRTLAIVLVILGAVIGFLVHPVCEPIDPEEVRTMNPPIHHRTDNYYGIRVFRECGRDWCQCKPWISRALFF